MDRAIAFFSLAHSTVLSARVLLPLSLLLLMVAGCECGDIVSRSCINDDDCAKSAPEIYCFEKKCSPFQCNPGEQQSCYEGPIETRDKGICKAGRRSCLSTGLWSSCVGQILARPELCDRLDNDCNGKADDGLDCRCSPGSKQQCYGGPSETFGKGTCTAGIQFCDADHQWGKCFEQVLPQKEQCDRLDNDCNGKVDDGIDCQCKAGESRSCYSGNTGCALSSEIGFKCEGACQQGKQFCSDGNRWGGCIDAINPQPEVCNGKDDNCDGNIDELFPEWGRMCVVEEQKGPCREGAMACKEGKLICRQSYQPKAEICGNGLDDNCDGQIDESPPCKCKPGTSQVCFSGGQGCVLQPDGTFVCKGNCQTGRMNCQAEQIWGPCLGQVGAGSKEICDGLDNNCDGQIDEDWPEKGKACVVGVGACQVTGRFVCKADGSSLGCDESPKAPHLESCDGIDNDCNGQIDDLVSQPCYSGPADTMGRGECRNGTQRCQSGKWAACTGEVLPSKELCDGLDNDCDGLVDEDFAMRGQACFKGIGECRAEGLWACAKDGASLECIATLGTGMPEICDGIDNDCDGQIDEDFPTKGNSCTNGVGECKKTGSLVCASNGLGVSCDAVPGIASAETCDNKDNDCDGQIDEQLTRSCYSGSAGTAGIGECRAGIQSCKAGQWGNCIGEVPPATEICGDGLDNNCDGKSDEGCTCTQGQTQACGLAIGECVQGLQTCNANAWGPCVGEVKPAAEVCDKKDNDCNGQIDENVSRACYSGSTGTSGIGLCRQGTQICNAGQWEPCQGEVIPAAELCDGQDNNCDGKVDENWAQLGQACTVGLGGCQQQGLFICTTDGKGMKCNINPGVPQPETCDNKDNDCDGMIDENLQQACYTGPPPTTGVGICQSGIQTCQAGQWGTCSGEVKPTPETCDGKDNNCNGQIDEGCQCQPNQTQVCGNNVGECRSGTQSCQNGVWSVCTGDTPPATERCDQKDNDCDGLIDEDFPQKGQPCRSGLGACDAPGVFVCLGDGSGVTCNASPGTPTAELCDGLDNDCDGQIDEDFSTKNHACTAGVGECQASGVNRCKADKTGLECDAIPKQPKIEVCDNLDNDCNGQIDDLLSRACYTGQTSTLGKGECKAGVQTCSAGQWGPCYGEITPQPEICGDGKDNNCDKKVDEGCGGCTNGATQACGSAIGECRTGTQVCLAGQWGLCSGGVFPTTEVCDDKDNDCDGSIDELWPQKGQACVVGVGGCQRNGTLTCRNDRTGLVCSATPGAPTAEICDGIDNNCNGQIDEGCP